MSLVRLSYLVIKHIKCWLKRNSLLTIRYRKLMFLQYMYIYLIKYKRVYYNLINIK